MAEETLFYIKLPEAVKKYLKSAVQVTFNTEGGGGKVKGMAPFSLEAQHSPRDEKTIEVHPSATETVRQARSL